MGYVVIRSELMSTVYWYIDSDVIFGSDNRGISDFDSLPDMQCNIVLQSHAKNGLSNIISTLIGIMHEL